eukprot:TRINITY_DN10684_c0_g1_i12.p1 TRINITY_DN10684_c0_g1~~TRINITY_DN10684_c0_g1_i12.p1  ORF type:complete len:211 (-),score=18.12 TRINITY_DN10684_c0_g1_i12:111-743(-)
MKFFAILAILTLGLDFMDCCLTESNETWVFSEAKDIYHENLEVSECEDMYLECTTCFGYTYKTETKSCYLFKTLHPDGECQDCISKKFDDLPVHCIRPLKNAEYEEEFVSLCHTATSLCKYSYKQDKAQKEMKKSMEKLKEELKNTQQMCMDSDLPEKPSYEYGMIESFIAFPNLLPEVGDPVLYPSILQVIMASLLGTKYFVSIFLNHQ